MYETFVAWGIAIDKDKLIEVEELYKLKINFQTANLRNCKVALFSKYDLVVEIARQLRKTEEFKDKNVRVAKINVGILDYKLTHS